MALMASAPKWIIQNSNFRLMKNTLALVLMVFGIVGCATNKMIIFSHPIDAPLEVSSKAQDEKQRFIIADSYN